MQGSQKRNLCLKGRPILHLLHWRCGNRLPLGEQQKVPFFWQACLGLGNGCWSSSAPTVGLGVQASGTGTSATWHDLTQNPCIAGRWCACGLSCVARRDASVVQRVEGCIIKLTFSPTCRCRLRPRGGSKWQCALLFLQLQLMV